MSVIVTVKDWLPSSTADPPETLDIEMTAVSFNSYRLSSVGLNVVVPVVLPALIVIVERLA